MANGPEKGSLEEAAAEFLIAFDQSELEGIARERLLTLVKDQLAIQVGAAELPWSRQVRRARRVPSGKSTLIGEQAKVAAVDAAFLNATYGHGFEYDDYAGNAHPGCCVVPTAIAVGEEIGATVGEVMTAMAAGYEVYTRIGYLGSPDLVQAGWQPHSVLANFGAAAVVAKLYGLDMVTTHHALSIALSHASGTTEYASTGGSIKRAHAGIAVRNGIESVNLAREGVTGPRRYLTGDRGLYRTFIRKTVDDTARTIFGLDEPLTLPSLSMKAYCSCAATHPYIDAMNSIASRARQIDHIEARIQTMTDAIVGNRNAAIYSPTSIEEVQYSLPVQMALAALGRGNGYETHRKLLDGELWTDTSSDVTDLARRIKLVVSPELDQQYPRTFAADVTVKFSDGSAEELFVGAAKGTPSNPFTPAEHRDKFLDLTAGVMGPEGAEALLRRIDTLDWRRPISDLTESLSH